MTILAICHVHDLSWDLDMDPPQCDCEFDIMVFEQQELPFEQQELPFDNHLDNDVQVQ